MSIIVRHDTDGRAAPDRLTEDQVNDLVDQFAKRARVPRPPVSYQSWLDDDGPVVHTIHDPTGVRTRIVIARPALNDLSPKAWRHLLADQIGYLRARRGRLSRFTDTIQDTLNTIAWAVIFAAFAWFCLRGQSVGVLAAGLGVAGSASLVAQAWFAIEGRRFDRYAVRLAGTDHATVDELVAYLESGRRSLATRLRYRHLHRVIRELDDFVRRIQGFPRGASETSETSGRRS